MKAIRNMSVFVAVLATATALCVIPTFAFADTQEDIAPDETIIVDEGFPASDDAVPDVGGAGVGAVESGAAVVISSDDGATATPIWEEDAPVAAEPDASGSADAITQTGEENPSTAAEPDASINGDNEGDGVGIDELDPIDGADAGEGEDANLDSESNSEFDDVEESCADGGNEIGDGVNANADEDQESADGATLENDMIDESISGAEAGAMPDASADGSEASVQLDSNGSGSDAEAIHGTVGESEESIAVSDANAQVNDAADSKTQRAKVAADSGSSKKPVAAGGKNPEADDDELVFAQNEIKLAESFGPLEIAIAKNLIEGALYGSASGTFSWSSRKLLTAIFGSDMSDKEEQQLSQILEALDQLNTAIRELQTTMNSQELDDILRVMKPIVENDIPFTVLDALKDLKASDDKHRIQSELVNSLGNGDIDKPSTLVNLNGNFDLFSEALWKAMTVPQSVTIDGQPKDLTLMQVWYEHLRYKYHWEHQAYEEWSAFQGRCVTLLATSLALEKASLQIRIEAVQAYNADHPGDEFDEGSLIKTLNDIQDYINQMGGYKGTVVEVARPGVTPVTKEVDYPGFFSEKTWAEQYWMYKERDTEERYYWTPGHEIVFYAQVNTQHVPQENRKGGLDYPKTLNGLNWYSSGTPYPKFSFWQPFVRYQGGDTLLASADQLKMIYKDYGSDTHLYTIFMHEDQGNFQGLDIDGNSTWWFVVDPDSDHPLEYCPHFFKADRLRCYVLSSSGASTDTAILCYYHNSSTEPDTYTHYIGIGVKRVGPEVYNPGGKKEDLQPDPEFYTAVVFPDDWAQWWSSHGDLAIGYEGVTHGGVDRVFMDGELLDPSCYVVEDSEVVLKQTYLASLGFGQHEVFLDTVGGGHTVAFVMQPDGDYYVESGEGSAWTSGASDDLTFVFKRTTDDGVTFVRLIDVLVDGASVPSWGYVAKAGSAIITLTSAFLDTLTPGAHTLTAVFEDGNDPQAAFTVRAASSAPQAVPVAYVGETAQPEGTPRTGDGTIFVMAFLALTALASAGVAARARRCA